MRNFESSDVDYSDQASFIDLNDFDWEGKKKIIYGIL